MHFYYDNVNEAFRGMVDQIHHGDLTRHMDEYPSRVGQIVRFFDPVTITYQNPTYRVLMNEARDCNPFFHLYEALWMLAGRNKVEDVALYTPRMREFSDDGCTLYGAYGYRWRRHFGSDQLKGIVHHLTEDPNSRRCVLQMWNACNCGSSRSTDLGTATQGGKDVPCNTQAYFTIREGMLHMTVCNRSNDLVWGMFGANVVHFSILQEYLAVHLGVEVGKYHQVTNDLHYYTERWTPDKWLQWEDTAHFRDAFMQDPDPIIERYDLPYFDRELHAFVDTYAEPHTGTNDQWSCGFLEDTAAPMLRAFHCHKNRDYKRALNWIKLVSCPHWQVTGYSWIRRRQEAWEAKEASCSSADACSATECPGKLPTEEQERGKEEPVGESTEATEESKEATTTAREEASIYFLSERKRGFPGSGSKDQA